MSEKSKTKAGPTEASEQDIDRDRRKPGDGRLLVSSTLKEGRRRAGIEFSHAGTVLELAEISQDQWELILADPLLTIRPAPAEPKADVDA
jgi:hypothetical protein